MATHKWSEIRDKMAPERRARIDAQVRQEVLAMELRELRQEAGKTQAEVAEIADMTGCPLNTTLSHCHRGLEALRRLLVEQGL